MTRVGRFGGVPAHVGHLESGVRGEAFDAAGKESEACHTGRLGAFFKQNLISKTDSQVGSALPQPLEDRLAKVLRVEVGRAVAERADARQDQPGDSLQVCRGADDAGGFAEGEQGVVDALQVTGTVVDQSSEGARGMGFWHEGEGMNVEWDEPGAEPQSRRVSEKSGD